MYMQPKPFPGQVLERLCCLDLYPSPTHHPWLSRAIRGAKESRPGKGPGFSHQFLTILCSLTIDRSKLLRYSKAETEKNTTHFCRTLALFLLGDRACQPTPLSFWLIRGWLFSSRGGSEGGKDESRPRKDRLCSGTTPIPGAFKSDAANDGS